MIGIESEDDSERGFLLSYLHLTLSKIFKNKNMNRIDMGYKHYREFAENLLQVNMHDLSGSYDDISIARSNEWAKEEIDRRMQKIFDQMYYYGFKPTCDLIQESQNNT